MKTEYIRLGQPHFQHIGAMFSATILVKDAVPQALLEQLKKERIAAMFAIEEDGLRDKEIRKAKVYSNWQEKIEKALNQKRKQEYPFKEDSQAAYVMDVIHHYNGLYYDLQAACIMPNHIHLLLDFSLQIPGNWDGESEIIDYCNLGTVLGRIKGKAASTLNKGSKRKGSLWMSGYYDRYIRSADHFHNELAYIVYNPVKAQLVASWKDYSHTYVKPSILKQYGL